MKPLVKKMPHWGFKCPCIGRVQFPDVWNVLWWENRAHPHPQWAAARCAAECHYANFHGKAGS